ncbi:EAL domain, c-di-GMP-specific phosphodiesterase class I (or its enzymatically inactive variant) [Marinomonas polaris DSM 16579]|uniref:EAL domain, c-di-GMP-specific phosphodiesterase class I (Or its enzymatically inactive variant) n=1 Tax=Marinomonas polaris DSM 16579 TaxID=1122206 RepID=A0A1M5EC54_9GAMM|nr:EAL domain-containing protein [Marinomonas polaris]SHF76661.1 EAL domain, c-di-GMP-specific phosphodiesterase class I (or its enzymatically inactive variant) [Marinomonas polaris DSM 16579]
MVSDELTVKCLSDALKNNEFIFHYQPILSLRSGKIDGAEALIRWQRSNGELVSAGDFIPFAEETGFITEITKAMIPRFLADQKKIFETDNSIVSSLNISAKDLSDNTFLPTLFHLIHDSGVKHSKIKIELTESSVLSLSNTGLQQIAELKANNIGLAIDDFGTGYATFAQLRNLPFTALKIDFSITSNAMATPDGLTLLDHSVKLAHQLNMDSIAEGVENPDIIGYLMGIGCEHVQGYYISRPLALSSFIEFINEKHVWSTFLHGYIYKAMIDYIEWVRKVHSSLYMTSTNRIVPFEAEYAPTGKFLLEIIRSVDVDMYDELNTQYNRSYELAKMMLNAKSVDDQALIDKLLPDFFEKSGAVNTLLQQVYSRECQYGLLKGLSFQNSAYA